jgi:hypothetical protein
MLCALGLALCAVATANNIRTSTTVTGTGPFDWTYDLQLSNDQNVNSGTAPTINPVSHINLSFAGFSTSYDFAGYVSGSCAGPAAWTCTVQNVGFTPDDVVPTDNPSIANITCTYTSGAIILGQPKWNRPGSFFRGIDLWRGHIGQLRCSPDRKRRKVVGDDRRQRWQHPGPQCRSRAGDIHPDWWRSLRSRHAGQQEIHPAVVFRRAMDIA